jgi:parvulin-like peptidyl-prolyl isomerase
LAKKRTGEKPPREYTKRQLSSFKKQQRRQRIIFISGISVIVLIALIILAGWFVAEYYPLQRTIATVYDTKIKQSMFIDTMELIGMSQPNIDLNSQSDYILQMIVQNELNKKAAEALGVTVSDQEVNETIKNAGYPDNEASRAMVRASLLTQKLQEGYFSEQVPDSDTQVLMNAMLVENEEVASQLRYRLASGDNFTMLAEEYALNTVSKNNKGVFDWHPEKILKSDIGSDTPVDWAFSPDVKAGDISPGLTDNMTSKKLGYWLIKVNKVEEDEAAVQALLLADRREAEYVKPLLEATDNITALVDEYSQHSRSIKGHGDMGLITADSDNISAAFAGYVFGPDVKVGEWSGPVKEDQFSTKGGAWIVQVVGKEENRTLSEDDRRQLINRAYSEWANGLWTGTENDIVYNIDHNQRQWAIERAQKSISEMFGGLNE